MATPTIHASAATAERLSLGALWSMLVTACATGPTAGGDAAMHARTTLQTMVREAELPGAQYLAVRAEQTLLEVHVGSADVGSGRAMTRDTLQMAYSITKAVTAIAAMQLVERGALELDRPLSDYYPAHPYGRGVTIRALLAHTAGVPNPMPLDWFALEGESLDSDARLRAQLARHPELVAAPSEEYGYTNLGYWLLEKAIEAASGQDYAEYVRQHVFDVLAVPANAARFELPELAVAAVGHARRMSPMTWLLHALSPSRYWANAGHGWSRVARLRPHGRAYGGLYCSAAALAPVLQDLLRETPRLLSATTRAQMLTEQRTSAGRGTAATLGWVVGELRGVRYFGKQGGGLGFHGNVRVYPSLGLATVLLANRTELTPSPIDARSDAIDLGFVEELRR